MQKCAQYQALLALFSESQKRLWFRVLFAIWALISIYDTVVSQLVPDDTAKSLPKTWQVVIMTGDLLPWWGRLLILWLILCTIVIIVLVETSRRLKPATENPFVRYIKDGDSIRLHEPKSDKEEAFIKFRPDGEILNGYNIDSLGDSGTGNFTIVFGKDFPSDDIKAFAVGTPPKNLKFVSVSRGHAQVNFDETNNPIVALKFTVA